jgi:transposase
MWKAETRRTYDRKGLRYPTDLTDAEWELARPFVDIAPRGSGRQRRVVLREVLNAVFYILGTGCQWRALPKDLSPRSTVHDYFVRWQCDGTLGRLHHALYERARELAGKEASPTTAIVDSQSVKGAERGGRPIDPVGYDAAKKVKGRKRHAVVDTLGLMLGCAILPGNVQDRDGCLGVLKEVRRLFPFLERVIADGAYRGRETARAVRRAARAKLEIVKRSDAAKGFVVLQKRWIVERTFGWLGRCRRLAKDFEALTRTHLAFVQLAMIRLMMRRIARASQTS